MSRYANDIAISGFAILPGWYVGEMGLDGAFAIIPKRKLKKRVEAIEERGHPGQVVMTIPAVGC